MDEILHEHYLTLKGFTERLEDIHYSQFSSDPAVCNAGLEKLAVLLSDMQRATDAAKEADDNF